MDAEGENILGTKRLSISRKNCPQGLTFLDVATLDTEETRYRGGNHKSVVVRAVSLQMIVPARIDGVVTDCVHCAVVAAAVVGRSEQDLCQHIASCRQQ